MPPGSVRSDHAARSCGVNKHTSNTRPLTPHSATHSLATQHPMTSLLIANAVRGPPITPARGPPSKQQPCPAHPVLGLQVGAAVQQQLRHVPAATPCRHDQRRPTMLRGHVPSTTTTLSACDRRHLQLAAHRRPRRNAAAPITVAPQTVPHASPRGPWCSSLTRGTKTTCWLYWTSSPRQRVGSMPTASALTAAAFFQFTGAPSSSSLPASAVLPAFAASQSPLANAFPSIAGVAMPSDAPGGGRALAGSCAPSQHCCRARWP